MHRPDLKEQYLPYVGVTFGKPENRNKEWWVEMEGLNSLLLMRQEYGKQTDVDFRAFLKPWRFIQNYQVDAKNHGLYTQVAETVRSY